jgi:hypothetical protein
MSSTRFDALAARVLARRSRQVPEPPQPDDLERAAALGAMTAAMQARGRRRWSAVVTVAAAASIALGLGVTALLRPGVPWRREAVGPTATASPPPASSGAARGAGEVHLPGGALVQRGQTLFAQGRDGVVLSSATGTELRLARDGELGVVEVGPAQRFRLARGWLRVVVAPLAAGERFMVDTADAEVEVHGTAFEVRVVPPDSTCRGGLTTRVTVEHGLVEIRAGGRDERVGAGQYWPPECPAAAAAPATARVAGGHRAPRALAARAEVPSPEPAVEAPAPARRGSELAAQNDLLAAALAEKERGQNGRALAHLTELLERWADSPLAESAMAERMRILQAGGDTAQARQSARDYLRRFPAGFARVEAERMQRGSR